MEKRINMKNAIWLSSSGICGRIRKENVKRMKRIIFFIILMILCSGCSYNEDIIIIVNFDSEIIAEKKIPKDVNNISCRNGYVFLGRDSQKYLDQIVAAYFLAEDNFSADIQILTQENIDTLSDITFYKRYKSYTTEPVLEKHTMFYENEEIQGKELLDKEEYAFLKERIQSQNICHVVEYQEGYQIYGWINCYDDSYQESLENKQQPLLSSITKGIAYKINTQNGKTEILEDREEGILFSL